MCFFGSSGEIVNPIGAGDTVSAVLLAAILHDVPMHDAFATALAAGTASCLRVKGSSFRVKDVERILQGMVVRGVTDAHCSSSKTQNNNNNNNNNSSSSHSAARRIGRGHNGASSL